MKYSRLLIILFLLAFVFIFNFCRKDQELKKEIFSLEKDLEIGVLEGNENYMFGGIIDTEVDSEENIYVLDWRNWTVKKYDKYGKFIRNIGQKGQGPGEFSAILVDSCLDRRNRLYVLELLKVHIFNEKGEFIRSFNPDFFSHHIIVNQEGLIILGGKRKDKIFHIYNPEGKYLESFGEPFPAPSLEYRKFKDKWCPSNAYLSEDGKIYIFNPFKYEICVYKDKKLERKILKEAPDYSAPEVTQSGERSYSYTYTSTAVFKTDNKLLAYYSSKETGENGYKGWIDVYDQKDYEYLGSLEVKGYPSALDENNHIYFIENTEVPKVIRYKIVFK